MPASPLSPDQPIPVRPGEELNATALQEFLNDHTDIGHIQEIRQFPSGFSNLTYALTTTAGEFILRRPPFGAKIKSAHDMGREFQVLTGLRPHFPRVPRPVVFTEDESVLGAPFYIMSRLPGVILRAHHARAGLAPTLLKALSENMVDQLVAIHAIDVQSSGLIHLGKPEGYVQRQVTGWVTRYEKSATDVIPEMDRVANWIQSHIPPSSPACFLHNDFKYDNVVLDARHLTEIVGVLDWEMATVGDPLMDLGATLAYWCEAEDAPITRMFNISWLPGNLTRQQVVERYREKSKRDVGNMAFYYAFGLFKNAVIAQQIYARWKAGYSSDPRFGSLIDAVKGLAAQAEHAIHKS